MRRLRLISIIGFLILLDQGIKLYIKNNLFNRHFNILGDLVRFKPFLNSKYSWINSLFDLGINRIMHIIVVILTILIIYIAFKFVTTVYVSGKKIDAIFIFILSGAICSLIDKLFWGGSLDYIQLKGLFIFDLKDVYVSIFEIMICGLCFINFRELRKFNGRKLLYDFKQFMKQIKAKSR